MLEYYLKVLFKYNLLNSLFFIINLNPLKIRIIINKDHLEP